MRTNATPIRPAAAGVLVGAMLWLGTGIARADVIELQWQDGGRFARSLAIAPGQFAEICGPLAAGQSVRWSFRADRALDFNIHYHVDKDVEYPARKDRTRGMRGRLDVDAARDYCWMWFNPATKPATLRVSLTRE
jgi:hypothetical protein